MKLLTLALALMLSGCASPLDRVYHISGADANVSFTRKQIDRDTEGREFFRIFLWCDDRWYEVYRSEP